MWSSRRRPQVSGQWPARPIAKPPPGALSRAVRERARSAAEPAEPEQGPLERSLERCQRAYAEVMARPLPAFFLEENVVQPLTRLGCAIEFSELPDAFAGRFKRELIELLHEYTLRSGGPLEQFDAEHLYRSVRAVDVDVLADRLETTLHLHSRPALGTDFAEWLDWFWASGGEAYLSAARGSGRAGAFDSAFPDRPRLSWRLEKFAEDPFNIVYQGDFRLAAPHSTGLIYSLLTHYRDHSRIQFAPE